jgi:predicted  nucleic acid-binding Zn-ribbon protein
LIICDGCATKDGKKRCTKCGEEVEEYAKPDARNNPECGVKKSSPVMDLVKTLKKKYQKTIYRRINKGVRIEYDETKGIVDEETKEVIITMDKIVKNDDDDDDNDEDNDNDNEEDEKEDNKNENKNENENDEN